MKLNLVLGRSGSGKTKWLYDSLLEQSYESDKRIFLVVPEQFTMQAQRNIVEHSNGHGTFTIDIVSFNRLAYRVFEELGVSLLSAIDDTGKNLILRKVIDENKSKLRIIKPKDSIGFVSEIKSVISELLQYSVSTDMLTQVCSSLASSGEKSNERLRLKLMDICTIYQAFREYIDGKFITTEEVTGILCDYVEQSKILKGAVFAFDGFTGFTPVQYRLIDLLFNKAESMYFTATTQKENSDELFFMSKDMLTRLGRCADNHQVIPEYIWMEDAPYRLAGSPALMHLERNLFRTLDIYKEQTTDLAVYSAFSAKGEVSFVAAQIRKLVDSGVRFREIGVIVSDMDAYRELIIDSFRENQIPVFLDNKRAIISNPAVEYLRSALLTIEKNYSYDTMFRLLKAYMCPIEADKIDIIENYVLALGVRGHNRWTEKFYRRYPLKRELSYDNLNEIRESVVALIEPLYQVFNSKESTVADYVEAIKKFLMDSQVEEKLASLSEVMEAQGNMARAKEHRASYEAIMELLDQTGNLLGDEHMNIRAFSDILDAGFNEIKLGVIPPTLDMVMVGDVERTRLDKIKALFFLGVNEGLVPKTNTNKGLLSEYEREVLFNEELEISPTCRQKAHMQNFYLYLLLTKASNQVTFTYNRGLRPSKLILDIVKQFPKMNILYDESIEQTELIYNKRAGMEHILLKLGVDDKLNESEAALLGSLLEDSQVAHRFGELADSVLRDVTDEHISRAAATALYGEVLTGSVSRMETFASCAFAHFAKYGLQLEERRVYELGAADLGTLFHESLRIYSMALAKEHLNFATVDEAKRQAYINEAVDVALTDYNNSIFLESKRNGYMRERIVKMLEKTVYVLGEQIKAGSFVPKDFERSFVFEKDGMKIKGTVDRVDYALDEDKCYVKIVDYKSSKRTLELGRIYDGLSLQLMVYLGSFAKDYIPSAALYYNIDNPIVDYEDDMDVNDAVLETLRPDGILNSDVDSIDKIDNITTTGKSYYAPFSYKKDGSLSDSKSLATGAQVRILGEYAIDKMVRLGEEITAGKVNPNPYEDSCKYCPYSTICAFNIKDPNCKFRKNTKFGKEDNEYEIFAKALKKNIGEA